MNTSIDEIVETKKIQIKEEHGGLTLYSKEISEIAGPHGIKATMLRFYREIPKMFERTKEYINANDHEFSQQEKEFFKEKYSDYKNDKSIQICGIYFSKLSDEKLME